MVRQHRMLDLQDVVGLVIVSFDNNDRVLHCAQFRFFIQWPFLEMHVDWPLQMWKWNLVGVRIDGLVVINIRLGRFCRSVSRRSRSF